MMAVTGLGFCCFLTIHLAGNLTIYGGKDFFNSYVEHLHSLGPLVTLAELGLLFFAVIHVLTGMLLFYQNYKARPVRYSVNKRAGGRTFGGNHPKYTPFLKGLSIVFSVVVGTGLAGGSAVACQGVSHRRSRIPQGYFHIQHCPIEP
jgi:succinate dehydrogenase / fumarate reductase cytochrome b subunit